MPSVSTRHFQLPPWQQGAAQSWFERGEGTARKPRAASSVLLLRDSRQGAEVFLRYRRGESPLGKIAFPGGSLEESDSDALAWYGPSPAEWARTLGMDDPQIGTVQGTGSITEVISAGTFEGRSQFIISLDSQLPYSVEVLEDPSRIVIDILQA